MNQLVLVGDSILDNAAYVHGRPAVIDQVRNRLPVGWAATLKAKDGSVIVNALRQVETLPADATHLVVSVGGNDVLYEIGILQEPVASVSEGVRQLAAILDRFARDYRTLMEAIRARGLPASVCTIYNPCSLDETLQREAVTVLGLFNDCIIRHAREFRLSVLELRAVCTEVADFVDEIEPSSAGGAKIAQAICDFIQGQGFETQPTRIWP